MFVYAAFDVVELAELMDVVEAVVTGENDLCVASVVGDMLAMVFMCND